MPERRRKKDSDSERASGEVVAALLSLLFGIAALTLTHWWSIANPSAGAMTLLRISSYLPNGLRIGPYGGKEVTALAAWLGSWLVLHVLLGKLELRLRFWIPVFVAGVFVLLLLLWPPVYHRIYGWPA
ncbi:hypothetical protein FPZ49_22940 [Paenibacillus cremeus]|uniref:Uncharacterized protein n=2 Tax=Paenibacillus cremeus TaxID=2163881 RepID=A0A559K6D1_9BACL|nr:hypothetical protein FPZ49_22940 [Paenibacillus cremeus]